MSSWTLVLMPCTGMSIRQVQKACLCCSNVHDMQARRWQYSVRERHHLKSEAASGSVGVGGAGGSSGASSISGDTLCLPLGLTGVPAILRGLPPPAGVPRSPATGSAV